MNDQVFCPGNFSERGNLASNKLDPLLFAPFIKFLKALAMGAHIHVEDTQVQIGFVFQGYHLLPQLSCAENIALPAKFHQRPVPDLSDRIRTLMEHLGLGDKAREKPTALSGGQKQRVALRLLPIRVLSPSCYPHLLDARFIERPFIVTTVQRLYLKSTTRQQVFKFSWPDVA